MNRSITAKTQAGAVPEIPSPEYVDFLERFRNSYRKTARGMIDMAKTIAAAKKELSTAEFAALRAEVSLSRSTVSKFLTIAESAHRFERDIDRMPSNWTTMYVAAKLDDDEYERLASSERFTPTMRAKQIEQIISPPVVNERLAEHEEVDDQPETPAAEQMGKGSSDDENQDGVHAPQVENDLPADVGQDDVYTITVDVSALVDQRKREAYFLIKDVRTDCPFEMVLSKALRRLIDEEANDSGAETASLAA